MDYDDRMLYRALCNESNMLTPTFKTPKKPVERHLAGDAKAAFNNNCKLESSTRKRASTVKRRSVS